MADMTVDAEGIRLAGSQIARVGTDLSRLAAPLSSVLGRLGTACDDMGIAEAAAGAQARWGQALDWAGQGVSGLGSSLTMAAASYELVEVLAGASFQSIGATGGAGSVVDAAGGQSEAGSVAAAGSGASPSGPAVPGGPGAARAPAGDRLSLAAAEAGGVSAPAGWR